MSESEKAWLITKVRDQEREKATVALFVVEKSVVDGWSAWHLSLIFFTILYSCERYVLDRWSAL